MMAARRERYGRERESQRACDRCVLAHGILPGARTTRQRSQTTLARSETEVRTTVAAEAQIVARHTQQHTSHVAQRFHAAALWLSLCVVGCDVDPGPLKLGHEDCRRDDKCPEGKFCAEGSCVDGACLSSSECPTGTEGRLRASSYVIVSRKSCEKLWCKCDSDCPLDFVC